jgi:hypothetical protein
MHPTFDPRVYTDKELFEKIQDLNARLTVVSRWQMDYGAAQQLWSLLEACENEYRERNMMKTWEDMTKDQPDSVIIGEDDPKEDDKDDD